MELTERMDLMKLHETSGIRHVITVNHRTCARDGDFQKGELCSLQDNDFGLPMEQACSWSSAAVTATEKMHHRLVSFKFYLMPQENLLKIMCKIIALVANGMIL